MFNSRLPPDLGESARFNILFRMWDSNQPFLFWMAKLMMASFRSDAFPAMAEQNSNDIRTFHIPILP
ncbi:hypothetical protein SG71_06935 [Enterobacter chengduensis]|uniref:Uncharacterized protein n=1 Tax=Enterobacter chengduensis TaxID=2494701 RepID=A0AAW3HJJ9_9ENTR|nr:hypothetical protein SG71_06935 [Enterobacter chengduensis]